MWFQRRRNRESGDAATEALKDAKKNLHEVQQRGDEVTQVSQALKHINDKNHFAEQLEDLFTRRRPLHD